ncbi:MULTISPECIES: hypothetical protein [unclassified Inquilinus]|uniref:hypothetical protein n=1 Tax=unclassified Inquilinus TaxID=2645927 RepID=UPI003F907A1F
MGRLKDLSDRHHRAWADGNLSYQDIADELGVSRQAVRQAFLSRGWTKVKVPPDLSEAAQLAMQQPSKATAAETSAPQPLTPTTSASAQVESDGEDWLPDGIRDQYLTAAARGTLKASLLVIQEAYKGLERNAGNHGPTALSGYMRALGSAFQLTAALLYRPDAAADHSQLQLLTMTPDEERAVREAGSQAFFGTFGEEDDVEDLPDGEPKAGPDEPLPCSTTPSLLSPIDAAVLLPTRGELRAWLEARTSSHGRRHLREIAEHVGLRPALQDTDKYLVDAIVHAIKGDPQRLRRPRS